MIQEPQNLIKQDQKEEEKSHKKVGLLKKRNKPNVWNQLYQNVDIKHVVNINDVIHINDYCQLVFINENALKDPENNESLMSAIFYYKMISKVAINEDNIAITLKKLDENALPPEYYLDRLRSYGDVKYYNIANYLQSLRKQFANFNEGDKSKEQLKFKKQNFVFQEQMKLLQDCVAQRKGEMYLIFFCQVYPSGVMLKKIILSAALLKQLGYNLNQIALDFIKHKHIFFEIFTAKMYSTMMQTALNKYSSMTQNLMQNEISREQLQEQNTIYYQDQMIRKKMVNGSYQQQLLSVRVKWLSPHPSVGIFEIDNVRQLNLPYFGGTKKIKKLQLPDIQQELKSLQHLTKIDPSLLQQNKNRCCTFKMIEQDKSTN